MSTRCSDGWAPANSPAIKTRNASTSVPVRNTDFCRDVGLAVIVVIEGVVHRDRTNREEHADVHVDAAWQPDVWKRLEDGHRGLHVGQPRQPLPGKEIPSEIVEGVLHDLVRARVNPERHLRLL